MSGSSQADMHLSKPAALLMARSIDCTIASVNNQHGPGTDMDSDRSKHSVNYPPAPASQPATAGVDHMRSSDGSRRRSDLPVIATHAGSSGSPLISPKYDSVRSRTSQTVSKNLLPDGQSRSYSLSPRIGHENGGSSAGTEGSARFVAGHKRTATGDIKLSNTSAVPARTSVGGLGAYTADTVDTSLRGNRIAALSVHLRTRLSYAAAQIEKGRQSLDAQTKLPPILLQEISDNPSNSLNRINHPDEIQTPRLLKEDSPDGSTVSAPDLPIKSYLYSSDSTVRLSPAARSEDLSSASQPMQTPIPEISTKKSSVLPKLAPAADILPSSSSSRRRRPNPNQMLAPSHHSSVGQRRYSEQQTENLETKNDSQKVLVPGTPPLQPLSQVTSTPYYGLSRQSTHSQNASMEQDAIETLLFMSSPGNSANYPHSQRQQSASHLSNTSISAGSSTTQSQSQGSQVEEKENRLAAGLVEQAQCLEAQAGDEIDRMLDQMEDTDSEEDSKPPFRHIHAARAPGNIHETKSNEQTH